MAFSGLLSINLLSYFPQFKLLSLPPANSLHLLFVWFLQLLQVISLQLKFWNHRQHVVFVKHIYPFGSRLPYYDLFCFICLLVKS